MVCLCRPLYFEHLWKVVGRSYDVWLVHVLSFLVEVWVEPRNSALCSDEISRLFELESCKVLFTGVLDLQVNFPNPFESLYSEFRSSRYGQNTEPGSG